MVDMLKRENQVLMGKLQGLDSGDKSLLIDEGIEEGPGDVDGEVVGDVEEAQEISVVERKSYGVQTREEELEVSEPLKKLEMRFKDAMEKVAELTDEKQKLEHLVLQLQGETETIGEYITLYQKQRAILQRKAEEKEQTFRGLVEQRNQQQVQLHQLKVLVAELLRNENKGTSGVIDGVIQGDVIPEHRIGKLYFLNILVIYYGQ